MGGANQEWIITVHSRERIIEVAYPEAPTFAAFQRYEDEVRRAILEMGPPWKCLVDQRAAPVLPQNVSDGLSELVAWARENGMRHAARVVKRGSLAMLQARQILRAAGDEADAQHVYLTREDAWRALLAMSFDLPPAATGT